MSANIQCQKCGEDASIGTIKCQKCGSRIIKACGSCGTKNSLAKNYCDSCGEPLNLGRRSPSTPDPPAKSPPQPPSGPAEPSSPLDTPWDIPKTAKIRLDAKRSPDPPPGNIDILKDSPPTPKPSRKPSRVRGDNWQILSTLAAVGLLCVGGLTYGLIWNSRRRPQSLIEKAAQNYLTALKNRDYPAAYALLSARSKANCTLEQFRDAENKDTVPWDFDPPDLKAMDSDWALVGYNLRVPGRTPEKDWLHFVREDSRWVRAYWWNLMQRIESAFDKGDLESAARDAQAAVDVNPRDSMARGYLCEAAYYREDAAKAELECSMALNLLEKYPSRLNPESIYHLHAILADTYKNYLKHYREAAREYEILLAFPNLSDEDRCSLHLARADALMLMPDSQNITDFAEALKTCVREEDIAYARHGALILSGQAGAEAAELAQNEHAPNGSTWLKWGENRHGTWVPEYSEGPRYKVSLREGKSDLLTAEVDLWTRQVKVENHVP